ncbi:MAG: NAD-dependent epimerase/dehydratase family protein [Candidatus Omnitrophota bacterium]
MAKNIFITGATGRIGRHLIKSLLSAGNSLFLLEKPADNSVKNKSMHYILGDLLDPDSYKQVFKEGIDCLLHMAAVTHTNDINKYYAVNTDATLHLVRLCGNFGVKRFIFISTRALAESAGDYSRSKMLAERFIRESSLDWIILRLSEVYGSSTDKGITLILNHIGKLPFIPIIGRGDYSVAPVHISDVIFAITKVIEDDTLRNKIYTIAGPLSFKYNDFIDNVLAIRKLRKRKLYIPESVAKICLGLSALLFKDKFFVKDQLPRLLCEKSYDISEAEKDFGFHPISIEEAVLKNDK